jgi:hypothetical protein
MSVFQGLSAGITWQFGSPDVRGVCPGEGLGVRLGVGVGVREGVGVGVGARVGVGAGMRVGVAAGVRVGEAVGVGAGVAVSDGDRVGVGEGLGDGDGAHVIVGVPTIGLPTGAQPGTGVFVMPPAYLMMRCASALVIRPSQSVSALLTQPGALFPET